RTLGYARSTRPTGPSESRTHMITLGVILLIIGLVAAIPILWTLGILLVVIGLILALLGAVGHAIGGRPHYWEDALGGRARGPDAGSAGPPPRCSRPWC